jgi:cytochrome c oxidase subunit 4
MAGHDATIQGHGVGAHSGTEDSADHSHEHPGERTYINVAIILSIVTAVEVAIYYIEGLRDFLVPMLIVLSVAKFAAVIGYFMHLKFDNRLFRWMFLAGLLLTASVVLALLAMFWTHGYFWQNVPES